MYAIQVDVNVPEVGQRVKLVRPFFTSGGKWGAEILSGATGEVSSVLMTDTDRHVLVRLDKIQPSVEIAQSIQDYVDSFGADAKDENGNAVVSYYNSHGYELNNFEQHALVEFQMSVEYIS